MTPTDALILTTWITLPTLAILAGIFGLSKAVTKRGDES